MPRKPSTRSAVKPAGPGHPALADRPAARRRPACGSPRRRRRTSPDASIGTKICAASPSSETIGGETPSCTPSTPAMSSASVCMSASSSSVSSPSPVTTTTAGMLSSPRKSGSRSLTCVASALSGRNDGLVVRRDLVDLAEVRAADRPADEPDQHEQDRDADPQPAGGLTVGVGEAAVISLAYLAKCGSRNIPKLERPCSPPSLALVGAIVYGAADFLGGLAAQATALDRRDRGRRGIRPGRPRCSRCRSSAARGRAADVAWGVLAGRRSASIAIALLYACLAIGPMSILSPLTAVVSAIAPMLWGLLVNGETLVADRLRRARRRARRRRAGRLHPRREGGAAQRARARSWRSARASRSARSSSSSTRPATRADSCRSSMSRATNIVDHGRHRRHRSSSRRAPRTRAASVLDVAGAAIGATPSGHADLEHASPRRRRRRPRIPRRARGGSRSSAAWWMPRPTRSCSWRCASAICRSCRR